MKILFLCIAVLYSYCSYSQTRDTIFYDNHWEETSSSNASYYRIIKKDLLYAVTDYYLNGQIQMKGFYKTLDPEVKHGEFVFYNQNGDVSNIVNYKNGVVRNEVNCYNEKGELIKGDIFDDELDVMPEFEGGWKGFDEYVSKNVVFPRVAQENGVCGRVYLTFCIMQDGSVGNIKVTRKADRSLDEEAIRVIKSSPKWKPGKLNGKNVTVEYDYRINFAFD
ncbi:energy transducer TonB [Plebeiibacterium sediminum]|uniref:TonB family protein n=1 Tax=Plebeiibacterium sediminum TaxID=2992112 RepID=A0AAE3M6Q9_9BACT|nr:energy transducer TonB [Plebeiobacterium sediminum]MCW3788249.1 TonB family protein [Plebeiobacterium sediminum]